MFKVGLTGCNPVIDRLPVAAGIPVLVTASLRSLPLSSHHLLPFSAYQVPRPHLLLSYQDACD